MHFLFLIWWSQVRGDHRKHDMIVLTSTTFGVSYVRRASPNKGSIGQTQIETVSKKNLLSLFHFPQPSSYWICHLVTRLTKQTITTSEWRWNANPSGLSLQLSQFLEAPSTKWAKKLTWRVPIPSSSNNHDFSISMWNSAPTFSKFSNKLTHFPKPQ